jgi:glycosyltransferase involved in cell wall biosynthesis
VRILFLGRRYWPAIGGVESLMRDLGTELARHHTVQVLALRTDDAPLTRLSDSLLAPRAFEWFADGPVVVTPLRLSAGRRALMAPLLLDATPVLRRYAYGRARLATAALYARVVAPLIAQRAADADVIHMWGGDLLAAAAVRAARLSRTPVVIFPSAHPGHWGDDPASVAAYRAADLVLAQLETDAAVYRRLGVPESRLSVCGASSRGLRSGGGRELRRSFGIDGPLVTYLGARRSHKGHTHLLKAAPFMASVRADVTLAFVGPGAPLPSEGHGLKVVDAGAVDEEARDAWVDASDVVCLPSDSESFGVAVLEAWSLGKPVVVSDIPPLLELVRSSGGGLSVDRSPAAIAGAILRLVADPELRAALGQRGRRHWLSHYRVDTVAARLEEAYCVLVEPMRRSGPRLPGHHQLERRVGRYARQRTIEQEHPLKDGHRLEHPVAQMPAESPVGPRKSGTDDGPIEQVVHRDHVE